MKHWGVIIVCAVIVVIGLLLINYSPDQKFVTWQSNCAADTLFAIVTVDQGLPTRGRCCRLGGTGETKLHHIAREEVMKEYWVRLLDMATPYKEE